MTCVSILFDSDASVIADDDDVPLLDIHETVVREDGQDRKAHGEVGIQDPVAQDLLEFGLVGAGVGDAFHAAKIKKRFMNNAGFPKTVDRNDLKLWRFLEFLTKYVLKNTNFAALNRRQGYEHRGIRKFEH